MREGLFVLILRDHFKNNDALPEWVIQVKTSKDSDNVRAYRWSWDDPQEAWTVSDEGPYDEDNWIMGYVADGEAAEQAIHANPKTTPLELVDAIETSVPGD